MSVVRIFLIVVLVFIAPSGEVLADGNCKKKKFDELYQKRPKLRKKFAKFGKNDIELIYLGKKIQRGCQLEKLQARFESLNWQSICQGVAVKTRSQCFKLFIRSHVIKSSDEVLNLQNMAVSLSADDQKDGFNRQDSTLALIENLVLILEQIKLRKFFLAKMLPSNQRQETEISDFKAKEVYSLEFARDSVYGSIVETQRLLAQRNRTPAAARKSSAKKADKLVRLQPRIQEVKNMKFEF